MNLKNINIVYLIGIGGIGMSALARYFNLMGKKVYGYDISQTPLTQALQAEGIDIHFEDDINLIPQEIRQLADKNKVLIIYTPAIPDNQNELNYFRNNGFQIKKRAEVLGEIVKDDFIIAIAGSHGKTTISAMIAHILKYSQMKFKAFIGGIIQNYNTNFLFTDPPSNEQTANTTIAVVEADEYDKSFLTLSPDIAVITSIDADHLDVYGNHNSLKETYSQFISQIKSPQGTLILKKNLLLEFSHLFTDNKPITYSINEDADYQLKNLIHLWRPEDGLLPLFNLENILPAVAVAHLLKINDKIIKEALSSFAGVKRRYEYIIKRERFIFIDDYAHHPEQLKMLIKSIRGIYPKHKVTAVFQPHLYTRTRDLADEFAKSLELFDEIILLPIYPAREEPIEGVNSQMLLDKINIKDKIMCTKENLIDELIRRSVKNLSANGWILVTIGAGDIAQLVEAIKSVISNQLSVKSE